MKTTFNLKNGNLFVEISKDEVKILNDVKIELKSILNRYCEIEKEDIDINISGHLSNTPRVYDLLYLKMDILKNLYYNDYYKDVVYFKNGRVEFVNSNLFYEFASAYGIIDDLSKGLILLKNILRVKIIDWLLSNEYSEVYNILYKFEHQRSIDKYSKYFNEYGVEFFEYLNENFEETRKGYKYTYIYKYMSSGYSKKYRITCSGVRFRDFLSKFKNIEVSRIYEKRLPDDVESKLNSFKEEFKKTIGVE